ncbi:MAG TPA: hypothetical protein VKV18_02300 [Chthonomonas sp.]|nr:hypothetical protein [Chthonomonas sp.]HLI47510.1 hypothetical protein [Chthonomonas sp.]
MARGILARLHIGRNRHALEQWYGPIYQYWIIAATQAIAEIF